MSHFTKSVTAHARFAVDHRVIRLLRIALAGISVAWLASSSTHAQTNLAGWGRNDFNQVKIPSDLTNVVAASAGNTHGAAVRSDGTVVAWGDYSTGQTDAPPSLSNIVAVAAGDDFNLALRSDGSLAFWGRTYFPGPLPTGVSNIVAISAHQRVLALRSDGTVLSWGSQYAGQTNVPATLNDAVNVSAGHNHNLALRENGEVVAWGDNAHGQINVPDGLNDVSAVAAGYFHSLALRADGTVVAWGSNSSGQTNVPAGLSNVVAIAAAINTSVALRNDGSLAYWGSSSSLPPSGITNIAAIDSGGPFTLAVMNHHGPDILGPIDQTVFSGSRAMFECTVLSRLPAAYQWQRNGTNLPDAIGNRLLLHNVQQDDAGEYSLVVSNAAGIVTSRFATLTIINHPPFVRAEPKSLGTWPGGSAVFEPLVDGSRPMTFQWHHDGVPLPDGTNQFFAVSQANYSHGGEYFLIASNSFGSVTSSVVRLNISTVVGWGANEYGQALPPHGLSNVVSVKAGQKHSLALRSDGTVVAWGADLNGTASVPGNLSNVVAIAAGISLRSLALRRDGTVVAWGAGVEGVTPPENLTNVIAVSIGFLHCAAILADGSLTVWGTNSQGELDPPTDIGHAASVEAGNPVTLVLRADGTVTGWGGDNFNIFTAPYLASLDSVTRVSMGFNRMLILKSDGTVVAPRTIPSGLTNIIAVAAGGNHDLVLKQDGSIVVWGFNEESQTNSPPGLAGVSEIAAGENHNLAVVQAEPLALSPPDRVAFSGGSTLFEARAIGGGPLFYQWQKDGIDIEGATNSTLLLHDLQTEHAGSYRVVVSNLHGAVWTEPANLAVTHAPPVVFNTPPDERVLWGDSFHLSADSSGSLPRTFQWYINDEPLADATNSMLQIAAADFPDAGFYSVRITNAFGWTETPPAYIDVVNVVEWDIPGIPLLNSPVGVGPIISADAGNVHTIALRPDGTVVIWGANHPYHATNAPEGISNVVAVAAGAQHNVVLQANGQVIIWGAAIATNTTPADLNDVVAIDAGIAHTIALRSNGTVVAWGNGITASGAVTNIPAGLSNVVAVCAGGNHSLALRTDGRVIAWGSNSDGQTNVPSWLTNVTAIAASRRHSMALRADGRVVTWGGDSTNIPSTVIQATAIAATEYTSCALLANGTVVRWPTGNPPLSSFNNVVAISGAPGFAGNHALALLGPPPVPPLLAQPLVTNGTVRISWPTEFRQTYWLEYKRSLSQTNWTRVGGVAGDGSIKSFSQPVSTNTTGFYRLLRR